MFGKKLKKNGAVSAKLKFEPAEQGGWKVSGIEHVNRRYVYDVKIPMKYQRKPVVAIGEGAFRGVSISEITVPPTVKEIHTSAFAFGECCYELDVSTFKLYGGCFTGFVCPSLKVRNATSSDYKYENGTVYSDDGQDLICATADAESRDIFVPEGVVRICDGAYQGFSALSSVTLPQSLKYIGKNAFRDCVGLERVVIPKGVVSIDDGAFCGCAEGLVLLFEKDPPKNKRELSRRPKYVDKGAKLEWSFSTEDESEEETKEKPAPEASNDTKGFSLYFTNDGRSYKASFWDGKNSDAEIPSECSGIPVTEIYKDIFFREKAPIKSLVIPGSVTEVPDSLLALKETVESVTLGEGVKRIGINAFHDCKNLKKVSLNEGLVEIGNGAFDGCESLEEIELPKSVRRIGVLAFIRCKALKRIVIPEGVEVIESSAFEDCSELVSVTLPSSLRCIESFAFSGCSSLEQLILPDGLQSIGLKALFGCGKIISLTLPHGLVSIEEQAFAYTGINLIEIPSSVSKVGECVFYGRKYLSAHCEAESLPEGWDIGWDVSESDFSGNQRAKISVRWGVGERKPLGSDLSKGELRRAEVPSSLKEAAYGLLKDKKWSKAKKAFKAIINEYPEASDGYLGCLLAAVHLSDEEGLADPSVSPEKLREYKELMEKADIDTSIRVGEYRRRAEYSLRAERSARRFLRMKKSGKTYVVRGFKPFAKLFVKKLEIPDKFKGRPVASIARRAFRDASVNDRCRLTEVVVPHSIDYIGDEAFSYCRKLESVSLPDSVGYIGNGAFNGCYSLRSIRLPMDISCIHEYAFAYCPITEIEIPSAVTSIEQGAFSSCKELQRVTFNANLSVISERAFEYCPKLCELILPRSLTSISDGAFLAWKTKDPIRIYYLGSEEEWSRVTVEYYSLSENQNKRGFDKGASVYIYSDDPPKRKGRFWRYGQDGEPVVWDN